MAGEDLAVAAERLRDLIRRLSVPGEIVAEAGRTFGEQARLMVRSSANCEDLAEMAGAGLYESVANVALAEVPAAVRTVWCSLWTRRAALSRQQSGIPHAQAQMAVLMQPTLAAELSFVLHTVNPHNHNRGEIFAEIAVGLGETLASGARRGNPWRLVCDKHSGVVRTLAYANFGQALRPAASGGLARETVDYSRARLSCDPGARTELGRRLAAIGQSVEEAFQQPQDIEGVVVGAEVFLVQTRAQQG